MRRERALKVVLVLLGLLFSAGVYPMLVFVRQDPALAMMMSLYVNTWYLPAVGGPQPVRESQPDRFRGMVEFRSRYDYDGAVNP